MNSIDEINQIKIKEIELKNKLKKLELLELDLILKGKEIDFLETKTKILKNKILKNDLETRKKEFLFNKKMAKINDFIKKSKEKISSNKKMLEENDNKKWGKNNAIRIYKNGFLSAEILTLEEILNFLKDFENNE